MSANAKSMPPNSIIVALLGVISAALAFNQNEAAALAASQAQLDQIKADRDAQVADLKAQLLASTGTPLTDEQDAQINDLINAAAAATAHPDVPPPVIDVPAPVAATPAPVESSSSASSTSDSTTSTATVADKEAAPAEDTAGSSESSTSGSSESGASQS